MITNDFVFMLSSYRKQSELGLFLELLRFAPLLFFVLAFVTRVWPST